MIERLRAFLDDLDASLTDAAAGRHLTLHHIGRSAMVWRHGATSTTQDVDVIRPRGDADLLGLALELFGKGGRRANAHGLYLEVVDEGLPPMPPGFRARATPAEGTWAVLRVFHLDTHDLAASKLRRFSAKDRQDIRWLCDRGEIDEAVLRARLESALQFTTEKDGDTFRDSAFESLTAVERYLRGESADL